MTVFRTSNITNREVGAAGSDAFTYDDLQGNLSQARLPAVNAPVWTDITLDGFTVKALAFDTDDYVDLYIETSHSVKLNEVIQNHIHWTIATDDDGDEFQFQITGVVAGMGEAFASLGIIKSGDKVLAGNAGKHNILDIGDIPAVNTTASTVYIIRLTRIIPDDGDDTAELIYVLFNDSHAKLDTLGSLVPVTKV